METVNYGHNKFYDTGPRLKASAFVSFEKKIVVRNSITYTWQAFPA
jgi:hypothetical protein